MKKNSLLFFVFISVLFLAFTKGHHQGDNITRIGCTQLNGNGCVCHHLEADPDVHVWITGPDTVYAGQKVIYRTYMTGGPAISGGYNTAVRYGKLDTISNFSEIVVGELTQAFPLLFPSDTINWAYYYTAPDTGDKDTVYTVGLSSNNDGNPNYGDYWNFGPKHPVTILQSAEPVELISFSANQEGNIIKLNWSTSTELNNKGFEVQRSLTNSDWQTLSFIRGNGTTTIEHSYSYNDQIGRSPLYYYRLKQIDFDGKYNLSKTINIVNNISSLNFDLKQNYPNPFNPSTNISFYLPEKSSVKIKIFDITGKQVAEILNENLETGTHSVLFNPDGKLSSGIYIYSLITPKSQINRKMIYLK